MKKSKQSKRWLKEHFEDEYVLRAQQEGYRSRAVYKLQELDKKLHIFKPGMKVIDLGAAPGGWSQYAVGRIQPGGKLVASDILEMPPIEQVDIIQGDFRDESVLEAILAALGDEKADLVMSDIAPNMSGMDAIDMPRAMYLAELASDLAERVLRKNGYFLCKMFQGVGSEEWLRHLRGQYQSVSQKKPKASRARSREIYVWASQFKG